MTEVLERTRSIVGRTETPNIINLERTKFQESSYEIMSMGEKCYFLLNGHLVRNEKILPYFTKNI